MVKAHTNKNSMNDNLQVDIPTYNNIYYICRSFQFFRLHDICKGVSTSYYSSSCTYSILASYFYFFELHFTCQQQNSSFSIIMSLIISVQNLLAEIAKIPNLLQPLKISSKTVRRKQYSKL